MPNKYLPPVQETIKNGKSIMTVNAKDLLDGYRNALRDYIIQEKTAAGNADTGDVSRYDDALRHIDDFISKNKNSNAILKMAFNGEKIEQEDFVRVYSREIGKCGCSPAAAIKLFSEIGDKVKDELSPAKRSAAEMFGKFKPMDDLKRVNAKVMNSLKGNACAGKQKMASLDGLNALIAQNPAMTVAMTEPSTNCQHAVTVGLQNPERSHAMEMQA